MFGNPEKVKMYYSFPLKNYSANLLWWKHAHNILLIQSQILFLDFHLRARLDPSNSRLITWWANWRKNIDRDKLGPSYLLAIHIRLSFFHQRSMIYCLHWKGIRIKNEDFGNCKKRKMSLTGQGIDEHRVGHCVSGWKECWTSLLLIKQLPSNYVVGVFVCCCSWWSFHWTFPTPACCQAFEVRKYLSKSYLHIWKMLHHLF